MLSALVGVMLVGCTSTTSASRARQPSGNSDSSPGPDTTAESVATVVIENTSVVIKTLSQPVQLAGCLCMLLPFDATSPKTLSATQLVSSIGSPLQTTGSHGAVELMAGYLTDEDMTGPAAVTNRPVWLLAVHDAVVMPSGPPDRPHIPQLSTIVFVYDAATGAGVVYFSYPEGPVTCPLPASGKPDRCGAG